MGFVETRVAGLLISAISGVGGYLIKTKMTSDSTYLPELSYNKHGKHYQFIGGRWHEYHFTHEPKRPEERWLAHAQIDFEIGDREVVDGKGLFPTEHRRILHYAYRGQVNSGNLYYTAVCTDDPDDVYCVLCRNINDDLVYGVIAGLDYSKRLFASPLVLSKTELDAAELVNILDRSDVQYFG